MVEIDSYSETNRDTDQALQVLHPSDGVIPSGYGQAFTNLAGVYEITSAKLYMKKVGSPTGNGHAVLYEHTGTYGTSSVPTGGPLATSDAFDVEDLTTDSALITFTFSGGQQYEMQSGVYYCIVFENPTAGTIDGDNYIHVGRDGSTPTHGGNAAHFASSEWVKAQYHDAIFYVYGDLVIPPVAANPLISKSLIARDVISKAIIR